MNSGLVGVSLLFNIPGVHSLGIDGFEIVHFCECTLHTLDLGVAQRFCGTAIVKALKCNIYKLPYRSAKKLVQMGSHKIAKDIKQYYKDEHKAKPWKKLSQLSKTFFWKHLGEIKKPCLKAKGGQTRCLVKFCTGLMQKYGHECGTSGQYLAKAGEALLDGYDVMDISPCHVHSGQTTLTVRHGQSCGVLSGCSWSLGLQTPWVYPYGLDGWLDWEPQVCEHIRG